MAHSSVKAKLKEWLDSAGGVRDWDISRDAPYFGFEIPDTQGKKFFYVWLDAPIGYLASFQKYCCSEKGREKGLSPAYFHKFMRVDDPEFLEGEMHHFLGKDIVNFHGLFWPAMLKGAGFREPTALHVNGYLTVNGEKMSKSRGTFIQARTYLDAGLNPEYLRYYFATMLTSVPTDIDLDLKAFEERVNSHLVGKWVNIASRTAGFVHTFFDGRLAKQGCFNRKEDDIYRHILHRYLQVESLYNEGHFAEVAKEFVLAADFVNAYIAERAPWALAKDNSKRAELHGVCTFAISAFRLLSAMLKPLVPAAASLAEKFLGLPMERFSDVIEPMYDHKIATFEPIVTRIDPKQIEAMIESSKESLDADKPASPVAPVKAAATTPKFAASTESPPATISIDDFAKLDLRIGKVLQCGFVEGSDKLLRFVLDAGELGQRQIFSGIKVAYPEPEKLIGRNVVFIANLAPRKMRFGVSEGMILCAGSGDADLFLLDADDGARAGMPVK